MTVSHDTPKDSDAPAIQAASSSKVAQEIKAASGLAHLSPMAPRRMRMPHPTMQGRRHSWRHEQHESARARGIGPRVVRPGGRCEQLQVTRPIITGNRRPGARKYRTADRRTRADRANTVVDVIESVTWTPGSLVL